MTDRELPSDPPSTVSAQIPETARTERSGTIPVAEERLTVERRTVESGRLRVGVKVRERQETVELDLTEETAEIERVPIGRVVETAPPMRQDGEGETAVLIIPVLEERYVMVRQLVLKEEIHVRKSRVTTRASAPVTVRYEEVAVSRDPTFPDDESP
jgi:uncharacterized protein (TIGR02271 family)